MLITTDIQLRTIMKKSQLLDIVCALTLFALTSSADAAIITGDDTYFTGRDQSHAQTRALSPSSFSGDAHTLDVFGNLGQMRPAENYNFDGTSSESPHTDSHISLWLLLLVASVFGILSEAFHRGSFNR